MAFGRHEGENSARCENYSRFGGEGQSIASRVDGAYRGVVVGFHAPTLAKSYLEVVRKGVLDGKSWFGNIRDMKAFVAFAGLLVAMGANAQFGDSMLDMQYGPFALLQRQDLRKELRLTKDQSKQMDEIGKNLTKASETGGLQLSGMQKVDDDMLAVLENGQKQRFSELRIQIRGATSLSDPAVAKALELTADQRVAVK